MADVLISVLGVVVVLGLMVLVHEFGHFLAARFFGVRVEVFSIGFGPRLMGLKRGATDYRVSALPVGGYVKMAGDNPLENRSGLPDEFLSKPRGQRTLIALAGPLTNIVVAIAIMAGLFMIGKQQRIYEDKPVVIAGVLKDSPAERSGIQPGDRVVEFRGTENPTWNRVSMELLLALPNATFPVTLERSGALISTTVRASGDDFAVLGYPQEPALIGSLTRGKPAERSGIQPGDQVLEFNHRPVVSPIELAALIQQRGGAPTELLIQRGDQRWHAQLRPEWGDPGDGAGSRWQMGVSFRFATERRSYPLGESIERSVWLNTRIADQILHVVGQLFQGRMSLKQVQGPLGIARESGRAARRGPIELIGLMAVISLNLGILNLLPIPILDGGHILMIGIESLLRRDLSVTMKERFVKVGLVFLLIVFAIVMYNDVLRLLPGR